MPPSRMIPSFLRRHARWLALLVLPVAAWLSCTDLWLPHGTSRISLWYAPKTFDQCSRDAPKPGSTFWMPTAAQIREAEAALALTMAARMQVGLPMPQAPQTGSWYHFQHQYIGFVRDGERLIYLNAYPHYDDSNMNEVGMFVEAPQVVCDGGRNFWGGVYRPATQTFESLEFNGPA